LGQMILSSLTYRIICVQRIFPGIQKHLSLLIYRIIPPLHSISPGKQDQVFNSKCRLIFPVHRIFPGTEDHLFFSHTGSSLPP
jgi:hypothetical protein